MSRSIATLDTKSKTITFHVSSLAAPPRKSAQLHVRAAWAVNVFRLLITGERISKKDVSLALVWLEEMLSTIHPFEAPRKASKKPRGMAGFHGAPHV